MSPLPTFVILSPQGAGGNRVAAGLRTLPGTFVPRQEIGFFSNQWDRGAQWYASWFRDAAPDAIAVGEHSTSYVHPRGCEVAAARIDGFLEGVKLVAVVRHPAARAREVFDAMRRAGRLDERDTFESLVHDKQDVHGLRTGGRYTQWLLPYHERFGSRLLVVSMDRMRSDPTNVEAVVTHLGLPRELVDGLVTGIDWPSPRHDLPTDLFVDEVEQLAATFGVDVTTGVA